MGAGEQDQPVGNLASSASDAPVKEDGEAKEAGHLIGDEEMSKPEEFPSGIQRSDTKSSRPEDYPHGIKLVMMLLSIYLSIFLVALDRTIIATALPQITDHFHSFADIGWVCLVSPTTDDSMWKKTDKMIFW